MSSNPNGSGSAQPVLPRTADDVKAALLRDRQARRPRYGTIGERLFALILKRRGHTVRSVHAGSYDFLVDGRKVDVKTKVTLHQSEPQRAWRVRGKSREPGVAYGYVSLAQAGVILSLEDEAGVSKVIEELTWGEAAPLWDELDAESATLPGRVDDDHAGLRRNTIKELQVWIDSNWHRDATILYRSSRRAQDSMADRAWGPEAFYQNPTRPNRPDIVVLVYFDRDIVYEVFAYPITRSSEIEWTPKPVGVNRAGRMTFDPAKLSPEFKFVSIAEFRDQFPKRFSLS